MIRTLQRKYIRTAMIAVTLVMVIFLIAINALNSFTMERDAKKTMSLILTAETQGGPESKDGPDLPGGPGLGNPGGPGRANRPGMQGETAEESAGESGTTGPDSVPDKPEDTSAEALSEEQYFSIHLSEDGQTIESDLTRMSSLSEEGALSLAQQAAELSREEGRLKGYRFRRIEDRMGGGTRYIFLSVSQQQRGLLRTLLVTLIVGGITWVLMLLLVIFLSKRAILPIARNIERQKQFVTDAGHEIKTPLAIIQANADVLELHMGSNKWIDNIRSQVTRLGSLTQNLLTLSRMEEGDSVSLPAVTFDAGQALLETLMPFREPFALRDIRIEEEVEGGVLLTAQRDAFVRLLSLLFENAVKYTEEGGALTVSLKREGREIVILQQNTTEAELVGDPERLFDRFYRADKARTQRTGGSGIGLSVARAITEQMGGRIRASYEEPRRIAFEVRLPQTRK